MSLLTTWGYTITDMDSLENMLDVDDFSTLTGGKYRGRMTRSKQRSGRHARRFGTMSDGTCIRQRSAT